MTASTTTRTATVEIAGGHLLEALAAIRPALSRRRGAHTWEKCVHLSAGRGGARLRCNTGEVAAVIWLEAQAADEATITAWVDAHDLQQALTAHTTRRGKRSHTMLEISVEDAQMAITSAGAMTSTVATVDPEKMLGEYPIAPYTLTVFRERFVGDVVAAATCTEKPSLAGLPILTGIHLASGKIEATDRYRLASFVIGGSGEMSEVTVPAATFAKMLKATSGTELLIGSDGERISVSGDTGQFTIRALDGNYPKVDKIVGNQDGLPTMTLQRQETIALLTPYATGKHAIRFTPQPEDLLAEVYPVIDGSAAPVAVTTMPDHPGDDLEHPLTFNVGYLHEILKAHTGQTVTIAARGQYKPAGITSDAPGRTIVLQPVRFTD